MKAHTSQKSEREALGTDSNKALKLQWVQNAKPALRWNSKPRFFLPQQIQSWGSDLLGSNMSRVGICVRSCHIPFAKRTASPWRQSVATSPPWASCVQRTARFCRTCEQRAPNNVYINQICAYQVANYFYCKR